MRVVDKRRTINSFTIIKEGARITRIIPVCCTQHCRCVCLYSNANATILTSFCSQLWNNCVSISRRFRVGRHRRVFTNRTAVAVDSSVILS